MSIFISISLSLYIYISIYIYIYIYIYAPHPPRPEAIESAPPRSRERPSPVHVRQFRLQVSSFGIEAPPKAIMDRWWPVVKGHQSLKCDWQLYCKATDSCIVAKCGWFINPNISGFDVQKIAVRGSTSKSWKATTCREREFFIDNLLVRLHFIIVMIK